MEIVAWIAMPPSQHRQIVLEAMTTENCRPIVFENVEAAMIALGSESPHLILFDGSNWTTGQQLLQLARQPGREGSIPCLVVTRADAAASMDDWLEAGATDCLPSSLTRRVARMQIGRVLEAQRLRQRLVRAELHAQSSARAKHDFLRNLCCELRTPPAVVGGAAEAPLSEDHVTGAPASRIEMLRPITANTATLATRTDSLLQLAELELAHLLHSISTLDILAFVANDLLRAAESKGLKYEVLFDGPIPETVEPDVQRLRQMLFEVIGNAVKFTAHGEVRVACRLLADQCPSRWQFEITDTRPKTTPEPLDDLFRHFSQVDTSPTRQFGGMGIGLTLGKRLVNMLGGDVVVASVPGQGTTVTLTFETGPLETGPLDLVAQRRPTERGRELSA